MQGEQRTQYSNIIQIMNNIRIFVLGQNFLAEYSCSYLVAFKTQIPLAGTKVFLYSLTLGKGFPHTCMHGV